MIVWIVGAGGLFGSSLVRARAERRRFVSTPVPWGDVSAASAVLQADLEHFASLTDGDDWAVVWAAGAGGVGTTRTALDAEAELVRRFAAAVREKRPVGRGALFLSSSAGMYAGSAAPPFDERTEPRPLNAYGAVKLLQEEQVTRELAGSVPVVVGRISTLYGPGQNLDKAQGLVTRLCLQAAMRRPIRVFVPMDTLRDYLFVDDAASMTFGLLTDAVARQPADPQLRVIAAGQATSVAELVALVQRVSRTRIGVVHAPMPANGQHVIDLRLRTRHPAPPGVTSRTLLATGVRRVYDDIMRQTALGALAERHGHG